MNTQAAPLRVASKKSGDILLTVGGCGVARSVSVADLISVCVRREQARMSTKREQQSG